ncbi:hypothetical protein [Nocardioides sp.]|uniref:hypothetical protein n=1 Tax=Nocardioides sp. TaxID=35761 RepID=UPI0039E66CB3
MEELTVIRTETAYSCTACGHAHDSHARTPGRRCSHDWCPCTMSNTQVTQTEPSYERQVFAARPMKAGVA